MKTGLFTKTPAPSRTAAFAMTLPTAKKRRALLGSLAFVLLAGRLAAAPAAGPGPYQWYAYSSGNMLADTTTEKGPNASAVERLTFNATDKLPGDYWVGAGVALTKPKDDNVIEFYVRKTSPQQRTVTVRVLDAAGHQGFYEINVPTEWIKVRLRREQPVHTDGGPAPADIAKVEFILNNTWFKPGETWKVDVAGMKTSKILPLPWQNQFWMPAKVPPPVPGNRVEIAIHNFFGMGSTYPGLDNPAGLPMAKDITRNLQKQFGPVGIEIGYLNGENGRQFAQFLHENGDLSAVTAHNHAGVDEPLDGHTLTEDERKAMFARNAAGQDPTQQGLSFLHGMDATNPDYVKHVQQLYLKSAKVGADVFRPVDYVWPYAGGGWTWTHSASALRRWPEDLTETDGGLELGQGMDAKKPAGRRVAHFWEYFASYHGYRMKPQDVGLTSWNEYRPPAPDDPDSPQGRNSHIVINMLYHYEWLKFANEVARPPAEQYGMLTQPVCNPEEVNNGTDLYWLSKLAFARGYWTEWWGGAGILVPSYYNGRYYGNAIRRNGKEIVIGGEVSAAGGNPYTGQPYYWDNMTTYLIAYSQAGSVDARAQNEQYWAWTWQRALDPSGPEYATYTTTRSAFSGFLQNRNDRAAKPKTDLLAVSMRAITQGLPYFTNGSDQPYNLGQDLVGLSYLHDGAAFPLEDSFRLADYNTIVLSSPEPPQGFVKSLQQWLAAKAGRTLITHSFVPTRFSAPVTELRPDPLAFVQPGGQEKLLGFGGIHEGDVSSGVLQTHDPIFKSALRAWDGKAVTFSRGICRTAGVPGERALVTLGGQPLVSIHRAGKGHVLYLHFFANETSIERGALQRAIVDAALRYAGYKPSAITPGDQYALMFQKPGGGRMFITYNGAANTALKDAKGKVWGTYQAQDPTVVATVRLLAGKPNAAYVVTDALTGAKQRLTSDGGGYVTVNNKGWNMRGLLVEAAEPAGRATAKR